ncbi:glycosyltransferase [Chryseobacterium fluminis]|uniref:glycosyltransferase n=1 Tax=Chryseobacterium fluminis TaxID=2983606 RepID=UPI00225B876F|nr:glycosyltransferase [Chryseobacterium sp. MMS21-Ot14]UZT99086.1 glycosyltransferase [Chryseobacterium sp. MMS21-Ot14]
MNNNISSDVEDKAIRQSYNEKKQKTYNKTNIVFVSTFPPKVCGIPTYTHDLIRSLHSKFGESFNAMVCPIETEEENYEYNEFTEYKLNISDAVSYLELAAKINKNDTVELVMLQQEFCFFNETRNGLYLFLKNLKKDVIITFHTVLPKPDKELKERVKEIADFAKSLVVMTSISAEILSNDYEIPFDKITVIPHGTHLLTFTDKIALKEKYNLKNKKVLSTFGLLGSGKNIETTLKALPEIIAKNPDVIFLILGKTHPAIVRHEGEKYRDFLEDLTCKLHLENNIRFINDYLPLPELLEYLQLTDVYLFTSKDRNQAVSGTFSYAISCGCAIVSTPIPHALEVLKEDTGIIIDFEAPEQLSAAVRTILENESQREDLRQKALEKMAPTAWENSSILHALLFQKFRNNRTELNYTLPEINLGHIQIMTTDFGMIQFSKVSRPDINSGYTLDNARAIIAICKHFQISKDKADLQLISIYLNFIKFCQHNDGSFLNYVDEHKQFTQQNYETNLDDSNGRAIWALSYLISLKEILPQELSENAEEIIQKNLVWAEKDCIIKTQKKIFPY